MSILCHFHTFLGNARDKNLEYGQDDTGFSIFYNLRANTGKISDLITGSRFLFYFINGK